MIVKIFFLENWRLIIDILSVIFVTIFFFIKKKPYKVVDALRSIIFVQLPQWINYVEDAGRRNHYDGPTKLRLLLDIAKEWFKNNGFEYTQYYENFIIRYVEKILSTPQKKGDIEDGKK